VRFDGKMLLLYSLLNNKVERNFYSKPEFSVKSITEREAIGFAVSLGSAKVLQITLIFNLTENFFKLTKNCCFAKKFLPI